MNDIFKGFGIEVKLIGDSLLTFRKIKSVLTRIGVVSNTKKELWQSCHILHKQGRYAIMHFKELYGLDGHDTTLSDNDLQRRNKIVTMLVDWGLIEPPIQSVTHNDVYVAILSKEDSKNYVLSKKYNIGKRV